jgi:hypothetical protein
LCLPGNAKSVKCQRLLYIFYGHCIFLVEIAALDCFTELLRILDGIVKDMAAKEFATFVQHIYRQTKAQKVILTLMLAAIPTPPSQKGWK